MNGNMYWFNFFSNLHMGGLGDNFSIVDNQVQRDPATDRPVVFASSLKGALRSHAAGKMTVDEINTVFGKDIGEDKVTKQGNVRFMDAHLLFYPLRTNRCSYMLATCPQMLRDFLDHLDLIGLSKSKMAVACQALLDAAVKALDAITTINKPLFLFGKNIDNLAGLRAESLLVKRSGELNLSTLLPDADRILIASDENMSMLLKALPVQAHNKLENGVSKALWYDEIVPRKSIFYTLMLSGNAEALNTLDTMLSNQIVQMGANATLGYGLCRVTRRN